MNNIKMKRERKRKKRQQNWEVAKEIDDVTALKMLFYIDNKLRHNPGK
jgi:hypothetical protein